VIEVDNLTKTCGSTIAVRGLSFAVQRSEIFGIVGPTSASKTITMECLASSRRAGSEQLGMLGLDPARQERELRISWHPIILIQQGTAAGLSNFRHLFTGSRPAQRKP
jgi:ABC-type multidrug transport system ATPase subunit